MATNRNPNAGNAAARATPKKGKGAAARGGKKQAKARSR